MPVITLENSKWQCSINSFGAELMSFYDKEAGHEYIWNGDPEVWKSRSPWLFPFIGKLNDFKYRLGENTYTMPMHGFANKTEFVIERIEKTKCSFCLPATSKTLENYPWRFRLWITYELTEDALIMKARVTNEDKTDMYFSLGGHPGLMAEKGDKLVFEKPEELKVRRLDAATHTLKDGVFGTFDGEITVCGDLFKDDAMIFESPASEKITLARKNGKSVSVEYGKVTWLGIWSRAREDLKYVCVEPWLGVDDVFGFEGDVSEKLGIEKLESGKHTELKMVIKPEK